MYERWGAMHKVQYTIQSPKSNIVIFIYVLTRSNPSASGYVWCSILRSSLSMKPSLRTAGDLNRLEM